jgi:hypothetical protein
MRSKIGFCAAEFLAPVRVQTIMPKNVTLKLIGEITDGSATLLVDQIAAVPPDQT